MFGGLATPTFFTRSSGTVLETDDDSIQPLSIFSPPVFTLFECGESPSSDPGQFNYFQDGQGGFRSNESIHPICPSPDNCNGDWNSNKDGSTSICSRNSDTRLPDSYSPSAYDVVCGRGKGCYYFPGNIKFRAIVAGQVAAYTEARNKIEKSRAIDKIFQQVRWNGGGEPVRFVKQDTRTKAWFELTDDAARTKVGHAMREAVSNRSNSSASLIDKGAPRLGKKSSAAKIKHLLATREEAPEAVQQVGQGKVEQTVECVTPLEDEESARGGDGYYNLIRSDDEGILPWHLLLADMVQTPPQTRTIKNGDFSSMVMPVFPFDDELPTI